MNYICNQVLPILNDIAGMEEGTDAKLDVLKLLAEICEHNGFTADEVKMPLENVFKRLLVLPSFLYVQIYLMTSVT